MRTVGIRLLKHGELSRSIRRAQLGEETIITDRGKPVAKLVPASEPILPDRTRQLVVSGLLELRAPTWEGIEEPVRLRPGKKTSLDYLGEQRR